jgi:hypothetical protein
MRQGERILGKSLFWRLKRIKDRGVKQLVKIGNGLGLSVFPAKSYYSPLPLITELEKNEDRWNKASGLIGVQVDQAQNEALFERLADTYMKDYQLLPPFEEALDEGFGPGYTYVDSFTTFALLRDLQPKVYMEVGSGLSTYYASQAIGQNEQQGKMICVEPYPYRKLQEIKGITLIEDKVQNLKFEAFDVLDEGDVLFIDSTHIVKIDGDVPYLFLEILPRLKKGVYIHIHDIPFPYNTPYPAEQWIFKRGYPMYWTEAYLLQAFLAFNDSFEIKLSTPLIRYHNEDLLQRKIPDYQGIKENPDTFSSIWIKKIK